MPTALTGSLGWTGIHPVQLGGPPLVSTFDQTLPTEAKPLIAHAYLSDGVTAQGTFSVLNRPPIKVTLANGGPESITLEVATRSPAPIYGQTLYGSTTYGGAAIVHGAVIRLSEQGGDGRFIYSGVVESLPDIIGPSGTSHQIVLAPFAMELGRCFAQVNYTELTDVAQMARDAFATTQHCSCDQVSVPPSTGIGGMGDFQNRPAQELLDTARAIAGPFWFWHVDVDGRGWFQPMGSAASYTLSRGPDYESRTSNGGDISDRKNKVVSVGGVTVAGPNATATYDGASQTLIGVRALNPPLEIPGVSDQATLQAITTSVGLTLDRTWQRVQIRALPSVGQRIHGSRPGGALLRYFEPAVGSLAESETGSGGYTGPFIVQSVEADGLYQAIEAGDVPITDQRDVDALVQALISRRAAYAVQVTPAALNLPGQKLTGSFVSGTGQLTSAGQPASQWALSPTEFSVADPGGIVRAEMGNLGAIGISPAQWGFRANDASGNPIFDSQGLIKVATLLGAESLGHVTQFGSGTGWAVIQSMTGTGINFTLLRAANLLVVSRTSVLMTGGADNYPSLYHAIWSQGGTFSSRQLAGTVEPAHGVNHFVTLVSFVVGVAAGSWQFRQEFALDSGTTQIEFGGGAIGIQPTADVILLGS